MNYAQIRKYDVANGIGVRTTLFVSGCTHNCPMCFNKEYQNFKYGNEWTQEIEDKFIEYVKDENVVGASILGGEPLQQDAYTLYKLLKRIKLETGKNIWLWTGYEYESLPIEYKPLLLHIDVLVDGRFIQDLKSAKLKFRGSSNQRVIDVKKTLEKGEVVLYLE